MQSKISLTWPFFMVSVVGILFFSIIIFFLTLNLFSPDSYAKASLSKVSQASQNLIYDQPVEPLQANVFTQQASSTTPVRLTIPKIKVNTALESVGLTSDGAMDAPKERANAAWFNLGPPPGENGSAVISGHYGRKNKKASVFDNLHKLRKGDKLYIEDDKGAIIIFVVRESRRYDPNADASKVFGSNDGKSHLNLVTCEGGWDKVLKSYSKRLVVFADKE